MGRGEGHRDEMLRFLSHRNRDTVRSGSVVVTAYDSESGRPGSKPEWGLIYYKASITA